MKQNLDANVSKKEKEIADNFLKSGKSFDEIEDEEVKEAVLSVYRVA